MDNTNFPLHRLPDKARLHVIKTLDYLELMSFSFTSTKSKLLVKSFDIPIKGLVLTINNQLYISPCPFREDDIIAFYIYENQEMGDTPRRFDVEVILIDRHKFWKNLGMSFNEIFQHLLSLFKVNEISLLINNKTKVWDSADVRNLVRKWDYISIENASDPYVQKLNDTVIPLTKVLILDQSAPMEENLPMFPQKIGIQNLEKFRVLEKYHLKLDDALTMNSKVFRLEKLTAKEVNRFVKGWIKGSNPRMGKSFFVLKEEDEVVQAMLLKGLNYQVMPEELERRVNEHQVIRGGFDIRNKQGKLATIHIEGNTVEFIVWN